MVSFNFIVALAMGVSSTVVAQYQTVTVTATVPCTAASGAAAALPTVDLGYAVQQATVNASSNPYFNFSNIRFGAAPVGDLRFGAPLPPNTINRTLNDGQQAVICPQSDPAWLVVQEKFLGGAPLSSLSAPPAMSPANFNFSLLPPADPTTSEDCLFLDVIVPESIFNSEFGQQSRAANITTTGCTNTSNSTGGAAVLVWIYGGGYTAGSKASSGSPAGLVAQSEIDNNEGIIYVAMNYRLGLFGWMSGPTFQNNGTSNAGLYDQRLALDWVQKYIHLFGGDPNRVTVIGESAGAGSIMHQITAFGGSQGPAPFQQAILQSPGFLPVVGNLVQESIFLQVLQFASVIAGQTISTLEQLRGLTTQQLQLANAAVVASATYGQFTFGPVVDGLFAPALPGELLAHGQFDKSLKVMTGHNSDEGLLFTSPFISNETAFETFLAKTIPTASPATLNFISQVLYPPVFNGSFPYTNFLERSALITSEVSFTCNTRYLDLAYGNQTYSYFFSVPPGLHGEDIMYTYFNGDETTLDDGMPVNATVALALQDFITSFTMSGAPNEPGVPFFPLYGENSTIVNLGLNDTFGLLGDTVANARCTFWQKALFY